MKMLLNASFSMFPENIMYIVNNFNFLFKCDILTFTLNVVLQYNVLKLFGLWSMEFIIPYEVNKHIENSKKPASIKFLSSSE